jgi:hypothetical protein
MESHEAFGLTKTITVIFRSFKYAKLLIDEKKNDRI